METGCRSSIFCSISINHQTKHIQKNSLIIIIMHNFVTNSHNKHKNVYLKRYRGSDNCLYKFLQIADHLLATVHTLLKFPIKRSIQYIFS